MWLGDDLKLNLRFESFVNSKGCKTNRSSDRWVAVFESFVNSKGCKTAHTFVYHLRLFESFVNSKGCKTVLSENCNVVGLRALLIQKDVKLFVRV